MSDRSATFFICDDAAVSLTGKFHVNGIYTGDIAIQSHEVFVPQMVVFFLINGTAADPFKQLSSEVTLPGYGPSIVSLPFVPALPSRDRVQFKHPHLLQNVFLRPGPIRCVVRHEAGVLAAGEQWIVQAASPATPPS